MCRNDPAAQMMRPISGRCGGAVVREEEEGGGRPNFGDSNDCAAVKGEIPLVPRVMMRMWRGRILGRQEGRKVAPTKRIKESAD